MAKGSSPTMTTARWGEEPRSVKSRIREEREDSTLRRKLPSKRFATMKRRQDLSLNPSNEKKVEPAEGFEPPIA